LEPTAKDAVQSPSMEIIEADWIKLWATWAELRGWIRDLLMLLPAWVTLWSITLVFIGSFSRPHDHLHLMHPVTPAARSLGVAWSGTASAWPSSCLLVPAQPCARELTWTSGSEGQRAHPLVAITSLLLSLFYCSLLSKARTGLKEQQGRIQGVFPSQGRSSQDVLTWCGKLGLDERDLKNQVSI